MASSFISKSRGVINYLNPRIQFLASSLSHHRDHHMPRRHAKIAQTFSGGNIRSDISGVRQYFVPAKAKQLETLQIDDTTYHNKVLNYPGGEVKFISKLNILPESQEERIHCYRILDDDGVPTTNHFEKVSEEFAIKIYRKMVALRTMDSIFSEAQKEGKISFYLTTEGEEAINVASAAALQMDDPVFPQYREAGVLLWRGFTLRDFANQCFGNSNDWNKGRQMPIHYGSNKFNYFTVSSTIAAQVPHAVGAAYSLKMDGSNACAVTYFGEGGTSTGDFHGAINFAAVLETPLILFCRNNGWAISTPVAEQFRCDGVAVKGEGYGVVSIRVDGNDALAIYNAVRVARQIATTQQRPVLIEALTYRSGNHTTLDDSTRYRSDEESKWWKVTQDPVTRFRKWLEYENWWNPIVEEELVANLKIQVLEAIEDAEKIEKPSIDDIFTDVYDTSPTNLQEQEALLKQTIKKDPHEYPSNFKNFNTTTKN
ncbi:OLC1v1008623C4 [Oldenlandia corymbosa var. corymbosa]|nr:OLC1v1008623C4 [Oldenlandia corymbosa var. corymbosa]